MIVALLTDGIFPYVIGGMQRHSFYLAKYLAAAGVEVDLYHTNQSDKNISVLEGFTEEEKKNIRSIVIQFPSFGQSPGHYIRESYEYSKRIFNELSHQRTPDFIYVKGFSGWELLNRKRNGEKFPPIGLNFHGYEMFQKPASLKSWFQARLLLRSPVLFNVKYADYLFSYGGKITDIIRGLDVEKNKIIEIPTGISADWINKNPAPGSPIKKFVFVGRYERRKGIQELTAVLRKIIPANKNFEFHFVGEIPIARQFSASQITYHGPIDNSVQLQELLRKMDVLVCPSFSEGMPNVILEGMASGLAIIATDVGATSVLVNETNGWLINPGDKEQLRKKIEEVLAMDERKLDDFKSASVKRAGEKFLW
ncbi:MAG TPA: glycosyltransferase family 4 protein, partial [Bacteroidia bacterium]|nr:glycosyltransferase family 4 protein [Bacteroidia bacterium]